MLNKLQIRKGTKMTKTEKIFYDTGVGVMLILTKAAIGLLLAFPIMWTWNYVMPYLFQLPTINWGIAWCLNFLCNALLKSRLTNIKNA